MKSPTIHATCVVIGRHGVLLRGASGAGKSRLALHFIETAAAAKRFARLVGDDRIHLEAEGGRLIASPPAALAGLIERRPPRGLRDEGIEQIDYIPAWPVSLVVDVVSNAEFAAQPSVSPTITLKGVVVFYLLVPDDFERAITRIEAVLARLSA